jgi:hypothetical protein
LRTLPAADVDDSDHSRSPGETRQQLPRKIAALMHARPRGRCDGHKAGSPRLFAAVRFRKEQAMVAVSQRSPRTSQQPIMRLVRDNESVEALHGRERRVFPRKEMQMAILGKRLDHSVIARRQPALALNVRDLSVGGLSALTETPLAAGERIGVSFPAEGLRMGWSACGRVLRCEPSALGYRIAVEFEHLPSAA